MNLLKKLDLFLLEKFPLLWHTKLLYACFFSVVTSLLFYLWGFVFTNESNIIRLSGNLYFEKSNAMLCLFILDAIFIIIWALSFYRKSAVKNLYPLQRFYFTRLFCSFLIIFWSLTWPSTTFNWGVQAKIRKLAPLEELKANIQTINFADAFLFDNDFTYSNYIDTYHPNITEIEFDYNNSSWKNLPTSMLMDSAKIVADTLLKKHEDLSGTSYTKDDLKQAVYSPSLHPENNDTIENRLVQFLVVKSVVHQQKCYATQETDYLIETKKLKQLCPNTLYDIRNFSKRGLSPNYFEYEQYKNIFHEYAERGNHFNSLYHYEDYPSVFSIEANKSFNAFLSRSKKADVLELLNKYEQLLTKHQIGHSLNIPEILDYVWKRQQKMNFSPIVGESVNDSKKAKLDLIKYGNLEKYEAYRAQTNGYEQPLYFVEKEQLEDLFSNSLAAHDPAVNWTSFIINIFFALGFAFVFFLFAIGNPINLIIAASVGGVFVILNVLFFLAFLEPSYSNYESRPDPEFRLFSQLMVFSVILYSLFYIFYHGKRVSKRLLLIVLNLCFALTALFPVFLFLFLESVLKREYVDACHDSHTLHSIFYYWVQDPIVIWISAFGAILLFTHFIKAVLAKPE